jgi:hypothetical protein
MINNKLGKKIIRTRPMRDFLTKTRISFRQRQATSLLKENKKGSDLYIGQMENNWDKKNVYKTLGCIRNRALKILLHYMMETI